MEEERLCNSRHDSPTLTPHIMEQEVLRSLEVRLTGLTVQRFTEDDEEMEQGVLELMESGNFPTRGKESDKRGWLQQVGCDERRKTSASRLILLRAASRYYRCCVKSTLLCYFYCSHLYVGDRLCLF